MTGDGVAGARRRAPWAPQRSPSVLSVQSHVVHGYVGNRAAVFPLQLLGFEVDVVNSVQFSCHTGYPAIKGQKLGGEDLRVLVDGLVANEVLDHTHLLTGYIGTASFLREVVHLLDLLPDTCCYVCDPVLGDNGKMYTSSELVEVYRDEVLPRVSILTPNQFEAELLAGRKITDVASAAAACDALHGLGPPTVALTTLEVPEATEGGKLVAMMFSEAGGAKWLLQLPFIEGGPFTGTGDLTAAMLLAWSQLHPLEGPAAIEKAGAVLQAAIRRSTELGGARTIAGKVVPPELRVVGCKRIIEEPVVLHRCRLAEPLSPVIQGVVFDLDGTLTLPGQVDFRRMRERTGVPAGADIVPFLREKHASDPAALAEAIAIVEEEERLAFSPPQLQPGVKACIDELLARGLRVGLVTRNCQDSVTRFLQHAGFPDDAFAPVVTRDSAMKNKPDPAPVLHCCEAWGIQPRAVLMVGDQIDDVRCGSAAGSVTVGMLAPESDVSAVAEGGPASGPDGADAAARLQQQQELADAARFTVSSLDALRRFLPR